MLLNDTKIRKSDFHHVVGFPRSYHIYRVIGQRVISSNHLPEGKQMYVVQRQSIHFDQYL